MLETHHVFSVPEYIIAAAGHVVQEFCQVHLCLTLLDAAGNQEEVLVTEQVVHDEPA